MNTDKTLSWKDLIETGVRLYVGIWTIIYGLGKILKGQFIYDSEQLSKPVKELSGFELTWIYFGHSYPFVVIIGICQIAGALFFMYPKTRLMGGFILLPIFLNIILIDIFYGIPLDALINAITFFVGILFVLIKHRTKILNALIVPGFKAQEKKVFKHTMVRMLKVCLVLFVLSAAALMVQAGFRMVS